MSKLSATQRRKLLEEVRKEFPDDEMMQQIHYVRLLHHHQTRMLSTRERVRFYKSVPKRRAPVKARSNARKELIRA